MESGQITALVKAAVLGIAPDAEVYLYGSRARGDFQPDSDWDFLVLCDEGERREVREKVRSAVHEVVFEVGAACGTWHSISTIVHSRDHWLRPLIQATPFHREVSRDGIAL
ncbi:MAG: nucleotidyltransferase domain-containing protein [Candidatus Hydrogenedens sp.]|nr:nucleotidyltransferase domain-containing protein [Candidatus Hydrogenedens sp.]